MIKVTMENENVRNQDLLLLIYDFEGNNQPNEELIENENAAVDININLFETIQQLVPEDEEIEPEMNNVPQEGGNNRPEIDMTVEYGLHRVEGSMDIWQDLLLEPDTDNSERQNADPMIIDREELIRILESGDTQDQSCQTEPCEELPETSSNKNCTKVKL
ncbi:uncharacterized protein LOC130893241 isoform X2 [Diorhabda carinulata]|uniref:uncharacterized protein LOC130893241 isoform X2 n=1 Tax=Diorhabda carinulata TaxID=1163345 RepID=UPI0025A0FFB3|nr:uncharacterized protein LOC130893241 isoform X2 [Diorhabda carinulata]